MKYLMIAMGLSLVACSGDETGPPGSDSRLEDAPLTPDLSADGPQTQDGAVLPDLLADSSHSDATAIDGANSDASSDASSPNPDGAQPDGSSPTADRFGGRLSAGAARSIGGVYVLHSQIGDLAAPVTISGGNYSLRCSGSFSW